MVSSKIEEPYFTTCLTVQNQPFRRCLSFVIVQNMLCRRLSRITFTCCSVYQLITICTLFHILKSFGTVDVLCATNDVQKFLENSNEILALHTVPISFIDNVRLSLECLVMLFMHKPQIHDKNSSLRPTYQACFFIVFVLVRFVLCTLTFHFHQLN